MGFARATEDFIRTAKGVPKGVKLDTSDKVIASAVGELPLSLLGLQRRRSLSPLLAITAGGALGVWNHPIEVIRVEMQSLKQAAPGSTVVARPQNLTMLSTLKYIYKGEHQHRVLFTASGADITMLHAV